MRKLLGHQSSVYPGYRWALWAYFSGSLRVWLCSVLKQGGIFWKAGNDCAHSSEALPQPYRKIPSSVYTWSTTTRNRALPPLRFSACTSFSFLGNSSCLTPLALMALLALRSHLSLTISDFSVSGRLVSGNWRFLPGSEVYLQKNRLCA